MEALVLLGPPGAGKGTAAAVVSARFDLLHLSTGELFRQAMREESDIGEAIRPYMDKGRLVPDDMVMNVISHVIAETDCGGRLLFDGFPRTMPQAEAFDLILADRESRVTDALLLSADRELLIQRLSGRQVCPECRAIFHSRYKPPAVAGTCDACGAGLAQRGDDHDAAIHRRLEIHERLTAPVEAYYADRGILHRVDANGSTEAIVEAILRRLKPSPGNS